jgi:hypothetical protein
MNFNEESFKEALSECKIIRWQNIFKNVVKAYLKAEKKQCTITDVSNRRELLIATLHGWQDYKDQGISIEDYVDEIESNL